LKRSSWNHRKSWARPAH